MPKNLATILAVVLAVLGAPAFSSSAFQEAVAQYNARRFDAAAQLFEQAIKENPSNAEAYFCLGQTLEELKDRNDAKTMYQACYSLNPFSAEGKKAKQALMNLTTYMEVLAHPTDSPQTFNTTIRTIDRQANELKQLKIDYGNTNAQYRMRLGAIEAARLGYYAPWGIDNATQQIGLFGPVYGGYRGPYYYDVTGRYELSNQRQIDASYQVTDARVQARRYQSDALKSAAEIQQSANNLTSLLGETKRPGEPKLRALGTNLFVRNYADFDRDDVAPVDPPVEMKATALRMSDQPKELHAAAKKLQTSAKQHR